MASSGMTSKLILSGVNLQQILISRSDSAKVRTKNTNDCFAYVFIVTNWSNNIRLQINRLAHFSQICRVLFDNCVTCFSTHQIHRKFVVVVFFHWNDSNQRITILNKLFFHFSSNNCWIVYFRHAKMTDCKRMVFNSWNSIHFLCGNVDAVLVQVMRTKSFSMKSLF